MCGDHQGAAVRTQPEFGRRSLLAASAAALGVAATGLSAQIAHAANSQNGWPVLAGNSENLNRSFTAGGVDFPNGVRRGEVEIILRYVANRFAAYVEPLRDGWCWGHAVRDVVGGTDTSNHASGTALDLNAPDHPIGASGTFNAAQRAAIADIISVCDGVVRWGGNYSGRKDEMHFELNRGPGSSVSALVAKVREDPEGDAGWPALHPGSRSFRVRSMKYLLRYAGFDIDPGSEVFGPVTEATVKDYQRARSGLEPSGIAGPKTWEQLYWTVRPGFTGDTVRAVQVALAGRGYDVSLSGEFGPATEAAVKDFQRSKGLASVGEVGRVTWRYLV